jgi:hypothetical protein
MSISLIVSIFIIIFTVLVLLGALIFLVMEGLDKIESFKERAPGFVTRFIESRQSFVPLLALCFVLLLGCGYELLQKEVPDVPEPPRVMIKPPPAPELTVVRANPPLKPQCWIKNYSLRQILPTPPERALATITCNTVIKPPYSIEVNFDEPTAVGPFMFPVGSEFAESNMTNQGTRVVGIFKRHTIIPNESFSILGTGPGTNLPLVKSGVIRAKGLEFDFRP